MGDSRNFQEGLDSGSNMQNLVGKVLVKFENDTESSKQTKMRSAIVKRVNTSIFGGEISSAKSFVEIVLDNGLSEWISHDAVVKIIRKTAAKKRMES